MLGMIAAANVAPSFLGHRRITAEELRRVQDPCVVFEHYWHDTDGQGCYAYTIGGMLDGEMLGGMQGGATVGGEVIIVHAESRAEADTIAAYGLADTMNGLEGEAEAYIEAHAALARMGEVSPVRRLELATAAPADKSDEFERDSALITPLRGDDILLTAGVQH